MTANFANNINKNQAVASQQVVAAVRTAAKKTGADFSFLMQKAATESSFNPAAKAKTSSATGLFQFIEQTWLDMVSKYGEKHGLSAAAAKIEMRNGRAVVEDPKARQAILNLRKDPAISALMAGEYCSENQDYLESNTKCDVGATELYLAHFMGAGGAAKFINSRDANGDAVAARVFPSAAKANRNIFYDRATGKARTLDDIYNHFAKKFSSEGTPSSAAAGRAPSAPAAAASLDPAAAQALALSGQEMARLPIFDDSSERDEPRFFGALSYSKNPAQKLSPVTIMAMTRLQETMGDVKESRRYNS